MHLNMSKYRKDTVKDPRACKLFTFIVPSGHLCTWDLTLRKRLLFSSGLKREIATDYGAGLLYILVLPVWPLNTRKQYLRLPSCVGIQRIHHWNQVLRNLFLLIVANKSNKYFLDVLLLKTSASPSLSLLSGPIAGLSKCGWVVLPSYQ